MNTMKKVISSLVVLLFISSFTFLAGDCGTLIYFKEGTQTTMTSYNDDGKITGSTKTIYSKVTKGSNETAVQASQESYDKKGKLNTKSEFRIKCSKGVLYFDMKMMMPQQQAEAYKDFEMVVEGADKEIPTSFEVGSKLKDADIKFTFKTKAGEEVPMTKMAFKITNRKVEAKESVTTSAGNFECYKISEDVEMKTIFSMKMKTITWFSFTGGTIKTESYKENGKFVSKSELTELKKGL